MGRTPFWGIAACAAACILIRFPKKVKRKGFRNWQKQERRPLCMKKEVFR